MTWLGFMRYFDPDITFEIGNIILMNETAYPFSDVRMTAYQVRSAIRASNNKIHRCDLCGAKDPYHQKGCLNDSKTI
jgi:hypothetical protein